MTKWIRSTGLISNSLEANKISRPLCGGCQQRGHHLGLWKQFLSNLILAFLSGAAIGQEKASNPLVAVNNTDVRLQYFDLDGSSDRYDLWADGAIRFFSFMLVACLWCAVKRVYIMLHLLGKLSFSPNRGKRGRLIGTIRWIMPWKRHLIKLLGVNPWT